MSLQVKPEPSFLPFEIDLLKQYRSRVGVMGGSYQRTLKQCLAGLTINSISCTDCMPELHLVQQWQL